MSSMAKRDNAAVPLTTNEGADFTIADNGSTDLFLPSVNCAICKGYNMYNPAEFSASKDGGGPVMLTYGRGQGTVEGEEYSDVVFLGGYKATNQSFISASYYSENFSILMYCPDGLAGFAFEQL
ncbi:hypothetical protein AZE42_05579 [Rhizopogon vesiculosus]|uniref:Peptidase A1 domain-containing protein n=1 Tax=Rhizopogon vesiculosus TaxID=180088 RepID=A0A1J8QTV6_9AGAM|nr:hypothetical protein AZE42_05579 [Rhizopogon vesiculosus]